MPTIDADKIINMFEYFLQMYGMPFIFIIAFIESLILLGAYFPGTIIIFGTIANITDNIKYFLLCMFSAILGIIAGYLIDYYLGIKAGNKIIKKLKLEKQIKIIKTKIIDNGLFITPIFYYLPGTGSMTSLLFGSMHIGIKKFLSIIIPTVIIWNIIWGSLIYVFGRGLLEFILEYLPFVMMAILIIFLYKNRKELFVD
jgi:membrane protein DedA with SNARE-associated domain